MLSESGFGRASSLRLSFLVAETFSLRWHFSVRSSFDVERRPPTSGCGVRFMLMFVFLWNAVVCFYLFSVYFNAFQRVGKWILHFMHERRTLCPLLWINGRPLSVAVAAPNVSISPHRMFSAAIETFVLSAQTRARRVASHFPAGANGSISHFFFLVTSLLLLPLTWHSTVIGCRFA